MNDADIVVDASAVIALLVGEPFTRFDPSQVPNALISAVNLSEVLARLQEIGMPEREAAIAVARLNLRVVAFDEPQARAAARLRSVTRHAGLRWATAPAWLWATGWDALWSRPTGYGQAWMSASQSW